MPMTAPRDGSFWQFPRKTELATLGMRSDSSSRGLRRAMEYVFSVGLAWLVVVIDSLPFFTLPGLHSYATHPLTSAQHACTVGLPQRKCKRLQQPCSTVLAPGPLVPSLTVETQRATNHVVDVMRPLAKTF